MAASHGNDRTILGFFQRFVHSQVAGSLVLLGCTVAALAWANSPWGDSYFALAGTKISIAFGSAKLALSVQHWINDALMAIFFFVVGLEIKRELVVGQLSSLRRSILPVMAALGGMVVPAAVYAALNAGTPGAPGWGIPMATDIAFALGILALFGKRVPVGLKVFLTALAIADDLGAVLVIALFYTDTISWAALLAAAAFLLLLAAASSAGIRRADVYILLGIAVWASVLASGVHATVAGVLVAMIVPVRARIEPEEFLDSAEQRLTELRVAELTPDSMIGDRSQLESIEELHAAAGKMRPPGLVLESALHPVQATVILPLFALFNAGVRIEGDILAILGHPVSLGIVLGLFLGKQIGVSLFSWLAVKLGGGALPDGVRWSHVYGASCLAGVGFTMSLFIGELAFRDPLLISDAKIGILAGSLLSAVVGLVVLAVALPRD